MPTVAYIAKEATPEQAGWRARIARNEKPLITAFLAWAAALHQAITVDQIIYAITSRSTALFDHVVQATILHPDLGPVMEQEAVREFDQVLRPLEPQLYWSLDLRDPNFTRAVQEHEARLVREVSRETRRAIANTIDRAYRQGLHPYDVAGQIRETIGLTTRQAQAVLNYAEAQRKAGAKPTVVGDRAIRYARRLRTARAKTIARTETARAMTDARIESYRQAGAHGFFDTALAELEWSAVQQDPTEMCAILDGTRVPLGETFDGLLPPAHPSCRCSVHLVLDR